MQYNAYKEVTCVVRFRVGVKDMKNNVLKILFPVPNPYFAGPHSAYCTECPSKYYKSSEMASRKINAPSKLVFFTSDFY